MMNNSISNFATAFQAEHIKIKRKGIYLISVIIGLIIPLIVFIYTLFQDVDEVVKGLPYNHYLSFIEKNTPPFASFFFPLLIILTISRITQLDHKNGGWKLMETHPLSKFSIYFSKFAVVLIASFLAILSLVVFGGLFAWILTFTTELPANASTSFPMLGVIQIITRLFAASLLLSSLQYFISVLISSFVWPIAIGFIALLVSPILQSFGKNVDWNPFRILNNLSQTISGSDLGHWFVYTEYTSIICSVMVLYIGYQWYKFKTPRLAFVNKPIKWIKLVIVVSITIGSLSYVLMPRQMSDYKTTVLSGVIESDIPFKNVYLLDNIINDTLAVIPVIDGIFHRQFKKDIVLDYYTVRLDAKLSHTVFLGTGDSIYLESRFFNQKSDFTVSGTRLAENQMKNGPKMRFSMIRYQLQANRNLEKIERFARALYKEWEEQNDERVAFKTIDNYIPKSDFTERNKNLLAITYLNYWEDFVKKRTALYPNKQCEETTEIIKLKSQVSLIDESLLSSQEYFNYVSNQMIKGNSQDIDANTKSLLAISSLSNGAFKDKMLYKQLLKSLSEASSTSERTGLMAEFKDQLTNSNYLSKITYNHRVIESLSRGKIAPGFEGSTIDGASVSLSDLQGKYAIIDVWASWCGPCKRQAPFFEKYALKYKNENIQFVSLSVDADPKKWLIAVKSKANSVKQLLVKNASLLSKKYSINGIPHFILIDPDGNLVNTQMPFPSESAFEILIRKELKLADEV